MTLMLVRDRRFARAREGADSVAGLLRRLAPGTLQVMGPAPAPLERLRGEYRVQVIVRAASRRAMQDALQSLMAEMERRSIRSENLTIDVNPMSTL